MEKFLLDPKAPGAFSSDVMHKVVLNGIDFELPDNIWDVIDDAFGNYWNVEVGYGGWPDLNSAVRSISNWLLKEHIIFPLLIRSLIKLTQQEQNVIPGPLRCANELLNNCFKQKTLPKISLEKNDIKKGIYKTIRQGIETGEKFEQIRKDYFTHRKQTSQVLPLFAYYIEGTNWPNDYSANPSINYKKDKIEPRGKYSKPI